MRQKRAFSANIVYDGSLFAIGGTTNYSSDCLASVETMNLQTSVWSHREPLPTGLWEGAAAVYNGSLYHCGGYHCDGVVSNCYIYSSKTGLWTTGPTMVQSRYSFGLVVTGGELFAIGGGSTQTSVERLNPTSGKWELLPGQLAMAVYREWSFFSTCGSVLR